MGGKGRRRRKAGMAWVSGSERGFGPCVSMGCCWYSVDFAADVRTAALLVNRKADGEVPV